MIAFKVSIYFFLEDSVTLFCIF